MAWDSSPVSVSWRGTANGTTSGSLDTSGKDFLVAVLAGGTAAQTISDSKSNTWHSLTANSLGNNRVQIFYAYNASCGSGHTFTNAGTGAYGSCHVQAYSGGGTSDPFHAENGAVDTTGVTFVDAGSVTPNSASDLVVTGVGTFTLAETFSISGSMTKNGELLFDGVNNFSGAMAWKLQTGALNPRWSWSSSFNSPCAADATFKAGSGGGGGGKPWLYYAQLRQQYRREREQRECLIEQAAHETILRKVA
ncbi:MAG TPA: hypothetical protein VK504_06120 [Vicinamibacterales bacterium]|nr:hypothetical protein [Vicinamibacterales bacterium]